MISRYIALGLLSILFFFGCTTIVDNKEEVKESIPEEKESIIDQLIEKYINSPEILIDKIIQITPEGDLSNNEILCRLYIKIGNYSNAEKMLIPLTNLYNNPELLKLLVIIKMATKSEYMSILKKIENIDPDNIFALNRIAEENLKSGDLDSAEIYLKRVLKIDNKDSKAHILLGDLGLKRVEKLNLKTKKVLSEKEERVVTGFYKASLNSYLLAGEVEDGDYYSKLAGVYKKLGDNLNAIKALTKAIKLDSGNSWNYYDRGKLYYYSKSQELALEDFVKAYSIDPDHFFTNVFLGRIYYQENKFKESLFHYNTALKINPNYTPAYKDISVMNYALGRKELSLDYLICLYKSKSDFDPMLPIFLVNSLIEGGRGADANKILENLVKFEKNSKMKEVYSYLLNPKAAGDSAINDALTMDDLYIKSRLSFYIACSLEREGIKSLSSILFEEVKESGVDFESKLAINKIGVSNE